MILWEQEEGTTVALQFEHILEPFVIRAQFKLGQFVNDSINSFK